MSQEFYETICHTDDEQWKEKRNKGIGASEIAIVIGENPWCSPLRLWAEKTGRVEHPNLDDRESVFWGRELEAKIVAVYGARTGRYTGIDGYLRRSNAHPWALGTLDAWTGDVQSGDRWPLEVKNVGLRMIDKWKDGPPLYYIYQVHQHMLITGCQIATVAALVGGQQLIWQDVYRDEIVIRRIIKGGSGFWRLVENNIPPDIDGSLSTKKTLQDLYPVDNGATINLSADLDDIDAELCELEIKKKEIEKSINLAKNCITSELGNATTGVLPSGNAYTWKLTNIKEHHVSASSYRRLRRVKK